MVATVLNVVERFLPILVMALIAASAISAAIRPYSMAVAPVSSFSKLAKRRSIVRSRALVRAKEYTLAD